MITYRCDKDNIECMSSICPVCRERTQLVQTDIFWCADCQVPLFEERCGRCGATGKRIGSDIRPVFPEERLLMEAVLGEPMKYHGDSVWNTAGNRYYANGRRIPFSVKQLAQVDADHIREQIEAHAHENTYEYFDRMMKRFVEANQNRYEEIVSEATTYIRNMTQGYDAKDMFVSFSGGKDSTVTGDLVTRALANPRILHIFGDTTLEFPETYAYVERFKKAHSKTTPVLSSRNKDKDFEQLCKLLGPPSRVMRWCCTIFKTGAITRKIQTLFGKKERIVAFYGIRRSESASRSKYDRESNSPKIAKQITVSPIIDWLDFDVWLYLLTTGIDFNRAYRLGYSRVGCWCCPNNSGWSEFLSKVYMPEQSAHFRQMLVDFAVSVGKPDADVYVDTGKWKARQGGNGLEYAKNAVVEFTPCATEENAFNYDLSKPISMALYELFKPFGTLNYQMGNARLGEVYVLNRKGEVALKLQGRIGTSALKVTIYNVHLAGARSLRTAEEKVKCQLTKYQMCMGCLACEGVCKHDAISIKETSDGEIQYEIIDDRCIRCGECVGHFNAGCYMKKVLATKRGV